MTKNSFAAEVAFKCTTKLTASQVFYAQLYGLYKICNATLVFQAEFMNAKPVSKQSLCNTFVSKHRKSEKSKT